MVGNMDLEFFFCSLCTSVSLVIPYHKGIITPNIQGYQWSNESVYVKNEEESLVHIGYHATVCGYFMQNDIF